MTTSKLHPRASTIFWGVVLLLIASVAGITAVFGRWDWRAGVWLVIAFGGLMVVAGVIGAIARAATRPVASTDRLMEDSTDVPLP